MNKKVGLQLVVYGLVLAGLSYLTYHLAPSLAQPALISGVAGGALSIAWGIRAMTGSCGKALPILTLAPVNFVLLSRTVIWWSGQSEGVPGSRAAAAVVTVMFVLSFLMLLQILYAGVVFDGSTVTPTKDAGVKGGAGQR